MVRSNLEGGAATPCLPSESVPLVMNNFIVFLMGRFSLNLITIVPAAVEALSLFVFCGSREQLVTIPLTKMRGQVGDSHCPSEPTISAP